MSRISDLIDQINLEAIIRKLCMQPIFKVAFSFQIKGRVFNFHYPLSSHSLHSDFTSLFALNLPSLPHSLLSSLSLCPQAHSFFIGNWQLGPVTGTLVADVRFDSEPEDEEFFDADDGVEELLIANREAPHKFLENRETSAIDNSII